MDWTPQLRTSAIILSLALFSTTGLAQNKTICGRTDDRAPSQNRKIGRLQKKGAVSGCTATMIGRSCAISAGHCQRFFKLEEMHFNVGASNGGRGTAADPRDTYSVVQGSIVNRDRGIGEDYVVFRTKANPQTGQLAGDAQGHYAVSFDRPRVRQTVRITGYGRDDQPTRSFAQQTHTGQIRILNGSTIRHTVDTMGGNSGSSILLESSQEIIGIHSHGGCRDSGGANSGTLIPGSRALTQAIQKCLKWEDDNL